MMLASVLSEMVPANEFVVEYVVPQRPAVVRAVMLAALKGEAEMAPLVLQKYRSTEAPAKSPPASPCHIVLEEPLELLNFQNAATRPMSITLSEYFNMLSTRRSSVSPAPA